MLTIVREDARFLIERSAAGLRDGEALPDFVEQEFRDVLRCGWLGGGFARFRCGCGIERLAPYCCKGRGFCPNCCGRRMTERAAHLVDEMFPHVPGRQSVLSLPLRLRYRLAWNHDLCRAVMGCALHAVLGFLRRRARDAGGGTVDPCAEDAPVLAGLAAGRSRGASRSEPGTAPASGSPATRWPLPRCLRGRGGVTRTTTARPPRRVVGARRPAGPRETTLPVRPAAPGGAGAPPLDRRRSRPPDAETPLRRRHHFANSVAITQRGHRPRRLSS